MSPFFFATTDGLVRTGLVAGESATSILLRQPEGKKASVLRKDIAVMKASPVSMMPEDLIKMLTPQELADAIGWLRHPPPAGDGGKRGARTALSNDEEKGEKLRGKGTFRTQK